MIELIYFMLAELNLEVNDILKRDRWPNMLATVRRHPMGSI